MLKMIKTAEFSLKIQTSKTFCVISITDITNVTAGWISHSTNSSECVCKLSI